MEIVNSWEENSVLNKKGDFAYDSFQ